MPRIRKNYANPLFGRDRRNSFHFGEERLRQLSRQHTRASMRLGDAAKRHKPGSITHQKMVPRGRNLSR